MTAQPPSTPAEPAPKKPPPAYLFALGRAGLPPTVVPEGDAGEAAGRTFQLVKIFKHDFFAATGLYEEVRLPPAPSSSELLPSEPLNFPPPLLAVLKIQRTHSLFGFPLRWLGRRIARHEIGILRALQGVDGIPAFWGTYGDAGFLHAFIPGQPLHPAMPFTPLFFQQLHALLAAIHARHIAYVDTNKRENILFGDDGRPWLIDFQISFWARKGPRDNFLAKWLLRRLQRADWYHFYKHKTRLLPAHCSPEDFAAAQRRGLLHSLHRLLARPVITVRRRFLARYQLEKTK